MLDHLRPDANPDFTTLSDYYQVGGSFVVAHLDFESLLPSERGRRLRAVGFRCAISADAAFEKLGKPADSTTNVRFQDSSRE